ncbi:MAG: LysM peptidoglycan-binding domain-containing protein [Treponema sp.]|nr:LysM peptidoglycan-binding domain-containing protein [Treponema sp.]
MKIERNLKNCFCIFALTLFALPLFSESHYTVKAGDTLYSISRRYEITVAELKAANNLESDSLKAGVRLVIPQANIQNAAALASSIPASSNDSKTSNVEKQISIYQVQKGDTLYAIARKFQTNISEILSINNIDDKAVIKEGQKLKVPSKDASLIAKDNKKSENTQNSNSAKNPRLEEGKKSDPDKKNDSAASFAGGNNGNKGNTASSASSSSTKEYAQVKTAKEFTDNSGKANFWPLSNPAVKKVNGKVSGVLLTGKSLEPVCAVREGTVMYTGVYRGFGEVVFVQSKTGLIYSYTGLGSVSCKKGEYVKAGDEIGRTGKGNDTSIKFMVFQNGMPVNPEKAPRG